MNAKSKKPQTARKPAKAIADSRNVRFGAGMAPARVVKLVDPATQDTKAVRFGAGMISAGLRKK